ncbi:hypothetical protein H4R19_005604, partial [Coemansia spiralis]
VAELPPPVDRGRVAGYAVPLWFGGNLFYGAYAVAKGLYVGLIVQPQLFAFFTLANILQVYWYGYKWSAARVGAAAGFLCVGYTGIHVGMWKAEELAVARHQDAVVTFLGVLPAILIAAGFFPQFYVSVKQQSVAMSNFFIALDTMGGVFSTISLAFDRTFDYVASITYLVVVLLDVVLVLLKLYFYTRGTQRVAARIAAPTLRESFSDKSPHTALDTDDTHGARVRSA